jgi:hypothetical protein
MPPMDRDAFAAWLERYFAAWRSNDPAEVEALFSEDAVYSYGPFRPSAAGRAAIVRNWVEGGVQPGLETSFEVLAVEGERGVAGWRVSFDASDGRVTMDGILVCDLDAEGRCTLHREWYEVREDPR